jgi:hypothetical protein
MHILNYQYRKEHALQKVTSVTEMFMNYDMQGFDGSIVQFTRITIWYNLFFKGQLKQPCSELLISADFQDSM